MQSFRNWMIVLSAWFLGWEFLCYSFPEFSPQIIAVYMVVLFLATYKISEILEKGMAK